MIITHAAEEAKREDAADLGIPYWRMLWQPLGLHRDIRRELFDAGKEIELVAKLNGQIIGGLVAVWKSDAELELRHLAVASNAQRKGIVRTLVAELLRLASSKKYHTMSTIARNTSADFRKMGFHTAKQQAPEHPVFQKRGITFEALEITVEPRH